MFDNPYLYIKSFHIISVISWLSAMLYLPRIFVYHAKVKPDSETSEIFKTMEYRLAYYIMTPAMISSWFFGLILIFYFDVINFSSDVWFHIKFLMVIILSACHGILLKKLRLFNNNKNINSPKYFKYLNEIPTILMVIIVLLVIVKPF
ncbi:protoporphyrinogen oxidase HemJ [Hyphomicrobiales bacterium]|jgi:putative membrane protein|nr:protoporphyrinogen oxidase HemJ [Hyphomicrobiales bacterium]MDC0139641.1 protoporphyrinogen oxidase HemJ [Hyphomicrobiales bacterium]